MNQPKWKLLANLGDANPIDNGGYFVFEDETGAHPAEAELLEPPAEEGAAWEVHRFMLDRCTYVDGVLSDNPYHKGLPAWFAHPESQKANRPQDSTYLSRVAETMGTPVEKLIEMFCSENPLERAGAYREIGEYHGLPGTAGDHEEAGPDRQEDRG